jgi:hypothetical protein
VGLLPRLLSAAHHVQRFSNRLERNRGTKYALTLGFPPVTAAFGFALGHWRAWPGSHCSRNFIFIMRQKIGTQLLKKIRERHEFHYQKRIFCEEHNLRLDAILHEAVQNELRKVERLVEAELGLDSIPFT